MMKRIYSLLAILLVIWACLPSFVSAHAYIYQSSPLSNAVLDSSPSEIKLTFTEKIDTKLSSITLENSAGKEVKGTLSNDGDQTLIFTVPKLEEGVYKVRWQVLSLDTHVTDGSFQFSIGVELETKAPDDTASLDGGNSGGSVKPPASTKPIPSATAPAASTGATATPKSSAAPTPTAPPAKQEQTSTPAGSSSSSPVSTQAVTESPKPPMSDEEGNIPSDEPVSGETAPDDEEGGSESIPADSEITEPDASDEAAGDADENATPIAGNEVDDSSASQSGNSDEGHIHHAGEEHNHAGEEHNHAGGHALMVFLRVAEILAAIAVGSILFFRYALWRSEAGEPPAGFSSRAEKYVFAAAAIIWLLSGWSRIDMLASQFSGIAWSDILSQTMAGRIAFIRPAAALLILALTFAPKRDALWANPLKCLLAVAVMVTFPLTGHAYAAVDNALVAIIAHSVHIGAAAVWVGGLAGLWMLSYRPSGSETLLRTGDKFSLYALPSIVLIIISGVWLTAGHLSSWGQLWSSDYGRLALVKIVLLLLVVGIAAVHRLLRAKASGERALVWGVRAEIVAAAGLIVVAGWLSTTSPPPYSPPNEIREPVYWHVMGENAHMTLRVNESSSDTQLVKLEVWLREDQGEPDELQVTFIPDDGDSDIIEGASGAIIIPVDKQPGESDPFGFPGFNKFTYLSEGTYFGAAEEGRISVSFKDKSGEEFAYEKPMGE